MPSRRKIWRWKWETTTSWTFRVSVIVIVVIISCHAATLTSTIFASLSEYWDLMNDDEKHDKIPEVWEGHNIADYIDPAIMMVSRNQERTIQRKLTHESKSSNNHQLQLNQNHWTLEITFCWGADSVSCKCFVTVATWERGMGIPREERSSLEMSIMSNMFLFLSSGYTLKFIINID